MKLLIVLALMYLPIAAYAQKVANYSAGEPGTPGFEEFCFWVRDGKRSEIDYMYGKDWKTVKITFEGKQLVNGEKRVKIKFANNYVLYIVPEGRQLKVTDGTGKYNKIFSWYYEGPREGIGTFCTPCAENEDEAMDLMKRYYFEK